MIALRASLVSLLLLLAACSNNGPIVVHEADLNKLYHREWELQSIVVDGSHDIMHVDAKMTLNFAPDGQVAGFGAVNRIAGAYKLNPDGKIGWLNIGVFGERKKGPPELLEKERNYLAALRKTNMLILGRHSLVLQRDDGSTVLQFTEAGY